MGEIEFYKILADQEIEFYRNHPENYTEDDFKAICERRGFNENFKEYIEATLRGFHINKIRNNK